MSYRRMPRRHSLRGFAGLGDYNDETQCSVIPVGDPYRKPGNYCATPDGGYTTFNADGSVYTTSSSSGGSWLDKLGTAITGALNQPATPAGVYPGVYPYPVVPQTGMSTTTKVLLAGAVVAVALIASR